MEELKKPRTMRIRPQQDSIIACSERIVDIDTGELTDDMLLIGRRKYVDKSDFTKVYAQSIGFIMNLNRGTRKIFRYILEHIKYEDSSIVLNPKEVCQVEEMVSNTYERAINGLRYKQVIAKSTNVHIYFVNPIFIYKCQQERFIMYTEYMTKHQLDKKA